MECCTKTPNLVQEGSAMSLFVTPFSDFNMLFVYLSKKPGLGL